MSENRVRKSVKEYSAQREKLSDLWKHYEPYLEGNIMSYQPFTGTGGTLTNLTPEQYEACLQTLAKMR